MRAKKFEYVSKDGITAKVKIDGKEIHGVRAFHFEHNAPNELPLVTLEIIAENIVLTGLADTLIKGADYDRNRGKYEQENNKGDNYTICNHFNG